MQLSKHKYLIGLVIFLAFSLWSLYEAYTEKKTEIVTMLLAVIGYFSFMVIDRIESAAAVERFEKILGEFRLQLDQLRAQHIIDKIARQSGPIRRLTSHEAFKYALARIQVVAVQ